MITLVFHSPSKAFNPCDDNTFEGSMRCLALAKEGKVFAQSSMARKYISGLGEIKRNIDFGYLWGYIVLLNNPNDLVMRMFLEGIEKDYMNPKQISKMRHSQENVLKASSRLVLCNVLVGDIKWER